ncbi:hypothetical protein PLEOSDRAFT_1104388 [Pleurotus ostreatus PC15]|uniref:Uncharacterized protein n=1 Tax=Pleurotus ostreatus (strain PC15) TaxID=1137138 RepID=A0A067NUC5_PLEO1|nr:hypothetical protein PLEOSDRAFT_1104388 [Pleurotus ostreatus PC15]
MLVGGGAECGPSNPLQGLTKRFDQDRGLQQDHFGGRAGPSREVFRSSQPASSPFDQDAANFFGKEGHAGPHQQLMSPQQGPAFDFAAMHSALPAAGHMQAPAPMHQHQQNQPATMNWAADFLQQPVLTGKSAEASGQAMTMTQREVQGHGPVNMGMGMGQGMSWGGGHMYRMDPMQNMMAPMPVQTHQQPDMQTDRISWDKEFQSHEQLLANPIQEIAEQLAEPQQQTQQSQHAQDDLAQIAGQLLAHVQNEQNPKFKQSQFLGLMKQLRDGEMVVKGNEMVQNDGSISVMATDVKGKGRAVEPGGVKEPSYFPMSYNSQTVFQGQRMSPTQLTTPALAQEDENDAYFRQENEEYTRYWNNVHSGAARQAVEPSQASSWDHLQADWDAFEATHVGIKPVVNYQFQSNNPYMLGDSTRHHMMHANQSVYESVLELEAAVQRDMSNASAWYELGIKQQENEREQKALQALRRAVELDPTHLPTWLALGISHTNDSDREGTYNAIKEWIERNKEYEAVVRHWRQNTPEVAGATIHERFNQLIPCLIAMATSSPHGAVDADVQVALAVLLNTNEDYEKATDCFNAALAVRPEDWLLYNRVGATMANSGRAEEARQYYYRALELNPVYIRARFNLGIACINLRRYDEAAGHILDALALQDNDGVRDSEGLNEKRGVTSTALWDSLKTACLHMQRVDLATLCDHRDLDGFRNAFHA